MVKVIKKCAGDDAIHWSFLLTIYGGPGHKQKPVLSYITIEAVNRRHDTMQSGVAMNIIRTGRALELAEPRYYSAAAVVRAASVPRIMRNWGLRVMVSRATENR